MDAHRVDLWSSDPKLAEKLEALGYNRAFEAGITGALESIVLIMMIFTLRQIN